MVFAIELLIECRKGINIGQNEFEYREIPEEGFEGGADEVPLDDDAAEVPSDPEAADAEAEADELADEEA